jgi:magnesium chelatase family protein
MLARVWSASIIGIDAVKVGVEVDVSGGLPGIVILGLPDAAIQESKERVRATLKNTGFAFPIKKIVINLTPADLRKEGPCFDLPISIGILAASDQISPQLLGDYLFLGEVSLDGSLRPVAGVLPIAASAQKMGIAGLVVPADNAQEASVVEGLAVYGFNSILEVTDFLNNPTRYQPVQVEANPTSEIFTQGNVDLKDVKGQAHGRRALEIAAAGGHNLIFVGPPGSGKTMLARRLPGILPPLTFSEALEVTRIHSVAGLLKNRGRLVRDRPFRSPHHSASGPSLVGGGGFPRPGEISLAHNGILFLDELSTNPCPCGYYGDTIQACTCSPRQREQYWAKLSGPLMDRIDLQVAVNRLKAEEITQQPTGEASGDIYQRVLKARKAATQRFAEEKNLRCNAQMQSRHMQKWCQLDEQSRKLLETAINKLGLSARASDRILKVARTIADLAGDEQLKTHHVAEAIQYRTIDRMQ